MKLTREEREMLDGKRGDAIQEAMEILVAIGECYDAKRMVPITSAHIACGVVNYGKSGAQFVHRMAQRGVRFIVPTTTNASSIEPWAWQKMGFSAALYQEQMALSEDVARMGGLLCNTCTPYLIGHVPRAGENVAWQESSAIIFVNSVLGARTNRHGGPVAIAAALTGRTPACGYYLDENRRGKLKIVVTADLKTDTDYSTLGYFAGRIAQDRVPIFTGIPQSVALDKLKMLGAAMATSGSVTLYHIVGVTPEAPTEAAASGRQKIGPSDTFEFGPKQLKETEASASTADARDANVVILGCPHASIHQLRDYAEALSGRKVKNNVEFWILVTHAIKRYAEDLGYASIIEAAGAKLLSNTCPATMNRDYFKSRGLKVAATDSAKQLYYVQTTQNVPCHYGGLESFLDAVTVKA